MRPKWNTTSPQPMYVGLLGGTELRPAPEHLLLVEGDVQAVHRARARAEAGAPHVSRRLLLRRPTGDPSPPGHHRTTPHGHRRPRRPRRSALGAAHHRHPFSNSSNESAERGARNAPLDLATAGQLNHRADAADLDSHRRTLQHARHCRHQLVALQRHSPVRAPSGRRRTSPCPHRPPSAPRAADNQLAIPADKSVRARRHRADHALGAKRGRTSRVARHVAVSQQRRIRASSHIDRARGRRRRVLPRHQVQHAPDTTRQRPAGRTPSTRQRQPAQHRLRSCRSNPQHRRPRPRHRQTRSLTSPRSHSPVDTNSTSRVDSDSLSDACSEARPVTSPRAALASALIDPPTLTSMSSRCHGNRLAAGPDTDSPARSTTSPLETSSTIQSVTCPDTADTDATGAGRDRNVAHRGPAEAVPVETATVPPLNTDSTCSRRR